VPPASPYTHSATAVSTLVLSVPEVIDGAVDPALDVAAGFWSTPVSRPEQPITPAALVPVMLLNVTVMVDDRLKALVAPCATQIEHGFWAELVFFWTYVFPAVSTIVLTVDVAEQDAPTTSVSPALLAVVGVTVRNVADAAVPVPTKYGAGPPRVATGRLPYRPLAGSTRPELGLRIA
jgi:hypothetical protein